MTRDCGPREPGRRLRFDSRRHTTLLDRSTRSGAHRRCDGAPAPATRFHARPRGCRRSSCSPVIRRTERVSAGRGRGLRSRSSLLARGRCSSRTRAPELRLTPTLTPPGRAQRPWCGGRAGNCDAASREPGHRRSAYERRTRRSIEERRATARIEAEPVPRLPRTARHALVRVGDRGQQAGHLGIRADGDAQGVGQTGHGKVAHQDVPCRERTGERAEIVAQPPGEHEVRLRR